MAGLFFTRKSENILSLSLITKGAGLIGSILITGGTGFFGNAFVKRLLADNLSDRICIYSRDEFKQANMRQQLNNDPRLRFFIGDVRDKERLKRAMRNVSVVVHAAALKRIEVGHYCPDELVKTNIQGTQNVIDAVGDMGVKKMVMLSTDKAYSPVSAYGHSKAMAECLTLAANNVYGIAGPKFSVTRYGNVSGSTGSIIPKWREILKTSDTVPVTDPECSRFWMYEHEAVDLVLNTIRTMSGGELVIPELPAYRVGDLAEAMGAKMDIKGLPDYEKMHESMGKSNSSDKARRMSVDEIREALTKL